MTLPSRLTGVAGLSLSFVIICGVALGLLRWFLPLDPLRLNIRWREDIDAGQRAMLERQLGLTLGEPTEGTTWQYTLPVPTTGAIRDLVRHPAVSDTAHIDRERFRPAQSEQRERRAMVSALAVGAAGTFALVLLGTRREAGTTAEGIWPARRDATPEARTYAAIALLVLVVYLSGTLLQLAATRDESAMFGFAQIRPFGWLVLAVTAAAWRQLAWLRRAGFSPDPRRVTVRLVTSLACGLIFYALRTNFINPDGADFAAKFARDIPARGFHATHDELWELWLHSKFWVLTNQQFGWTVEHSYQVLSCVCGVVFVFLLLTFCVDLVPRRPWSAFALGMSAGYLQLFFGDVENYTMTAMWVMAYLLAAVRFLHRRWSVFPAAWLLALAMTFHLEAGFLAPSLLYLLALAVRRGRWIQAIGAAAAAALIIVGTLWFFHVSGLPIRSLYYESHAFGRGGDMSRMLVTPSFEYYLRLGNLGLLLAPASVLLLPLAGYRRIALDAINIHLLLASAFMTLFALSWNATLGVYNDWNLFAICALPPTILAARNVLDPSLERGVKGPVAAVNLLFLVHSASWIAANHFG